MFFKKRVSKNMTIWDLDWYYLGILKKKNATILKKKKKKGVKSWISLLWTPKMKIFLSVQPF